MGASSSSWVIVGMACREFDNDFTCAKRLGVWYGNLKFMVFPSSTGIRTTPFGVGTWYEV